MSWLCPSFVKVRTRLFLFDERSFLALAPEKILRPSGGGGGGVLWWWCDKKPFDKNKTENTKHGVARPRAGTTRDAGVGLLSTHAVVVVTRLGCHTRGAEHKSKSACFRTRTHFPGVGVITLLTQVVAKLSPRLRPPRTRSNIVFFQCSHLLFSAVLREERSSRTAFIPFAFESLLFA